MPSEAKKLGSVNVSIMEDEEGKKYLHVTGDAMYAYLCVWHDQMDLARKEEREKIFEKMKERDGNCKVS